MANLPFLPFTILFSAVSVLIDAVSQLFNVVGLGTFDFGNLIKGKGLNFNFNINDPGFKFDPPGNIIEALGKCIPLIMNSLTTLPQMILNGLAENLWLFTSGLGTIFNSATWTSDKVLVQAIQDGSWATSLSVENSKLSMENSNLTMELKVYEDNKEKIEENIKENNGWSYKHGQFRSNDELEAELSSINKKISEILRKKSENENKIEINNSKIEELNKVKINLPTDNSTETASLSSGN